LGKSTRALLSGGSEEWLAPGFLRKKGLAGAKPFSRNYAARISLA